MRFSSLSLVREAVPRSSRIRRHLPFALFLVGLGSLVVAMARPAAIVPVPAGKTTVVLAMDVSRSMCATDIPPNRLVAAEEAASSFVERQGGDDADRDRRVRRATPRSSRRRRTTRRSCSTSSRALATGRRTAIGSAILEAIDAIAEVDPSVASESWTSRPGCGGAAGGPEGRLRAGDHRAADRWREQRGPGAGRGGRSRPPTRGIRVYTIGFGTEDPGGRPPSCGAQFIGREPGDNGQGFGGGFGGGDSAGGGGFRRAIDEDTLKAVAEATGGEYYPAESANQLDEGLRRAARRT